MKTVAVIKTDLVISEKMKKMVTKLSMVAKMEKRRWMKIWKREKRTWKRAKRTWKTALTNKCVNPILNRQLMMILMARMKFRRSQIVVIMLRSKKTTMRMKKTKKSSFMIQIVKIQMSF